MDEDDFLLDEEDEDTYLSPDDTTESEDDDIGDSEEDDDSAKIDESLYQGKLSGDELWLITAYNDVQKSKEVEEAATIIVMANPQHTSTNTVAQIIKDMFQKQGHSRMQATQYSQGLLRGDDMKGIAHLAQKIAETYYEEVPKEKRNGKVQVNVSTSFFVPKPFTPRCTSVNTLPSDLASAPSSK